MRAGIIVILASSLLGVLYVTWHLWRITPGGWVAKLLVALLFLLWMAAAFASMLLREKASIPTITALYELGHPWMIAFLYLLIVFILADIGVLVRLIPKNWLTSNAISMASILGMIAIVLMAGGIPVLAHPSYGSGEEIIVGDKMDMRLKRLMEYGLHGVEAFYSGFTNKLISEMLFFADKYDLYVTAGSDYHGKNKMEELGDNNLPDKDE